MPRRRRLPEIDSEGEGENYDYPDSEGIDDEYETSSGPSLQEYSDLNEEDSLDDKSSSSSENSGSEEDLDFELAQLHDNMSDFADFEEEADVPRSEEQPSDGRDGRLPVDNEDLENDTAELRRDLEALETETSLRLKYPPEFWNSEPIPYVDECSVLGDLMALDEHHVNVDSTEDSLEFWAEELDEFYIYRSRYHPGGFHGQYELLHRVASEPGKQHWVFSGVIRSQNQQQHITGYVHGVSIGNVADLNTYTTAGAIWIRSEVGEKKDCWYQLREPYWGYSTHWAQFLWLADFAKLFNDYLHESSKGGKLVTLLDFKSDFWSQLQKWHGAALNSWYHRRAPKLTGVPLDFRQDVAVHKDFLRHLVFSSEGDAEKEKRHPVWEEVVAFDDDIQVTSKDEKTVVTRNVATCFQETFSHWQKKFRLLEVVEMSPEVQEFRETRRRLWGFPDKFAGNPNADFFTDPKTSTKLSLVDKLLELVGTKRHSTRFSHADELTNKIAIVRVPNEKRNDADFCYVWVREAISPTKIAVVWLVRPFETLCGTGFYPRGNELFFSTRCNCKAVCVRDVVEAIDASVFSGQATHGAQLFVHGLYDEVQQAHLTANKTNVVCHCQDNFYQSPKKSPYHDSRQDKLPKLKALSLFSGAGLLAWSMASSGYIQTVLAIELSRIASASFKANDELNQVEVKNASVNACLAEYLRCWKPFEGFDMIDAGPSCKGFSLLNAMKSLKNSQQQQSLLANTISWFEAFLPVYGIIENVPNMDSGSPNPCEQAICVLVALGYQVRKMTLVASALGGASSRKRLIIMVAAPDAELPDDIEETHGEGDRYAEAGMRPIRTCEDVISDLAPITNDTTINIPDPCHVPLHRFGINFSKGVNMLDVVERIPAGLGLAHTAALNLLSRDQQEWFRGLSEWQQDPQKKTLRRINRSKPFHTVTTQIAPLDAKHSGQILHYEQHRTISCKEAALAMDTPPGFLVMGNVRQRYKQLGNAVAWSVGSKLGSTIGKSWRATVIKRRWRQNPVSKRESTSEPVAGSPASYIPSPNHFRQPARVPNNPPTTPIKKGGEVEYYEVAVQTSRKRERRVAYDDSDSDVEFVSSKPASKRSYQG